ncbi:MAG: glycosyltransferase [Euryarchaeota archaeon]|nr:glycosyltransferase [Euryarchaeota archaeon]
MDILSFQSSDKKMTGGHRPYNIDKALESLGDKVTRVVNWRDWGIDRKLVKRLTPTQINNRLKLKKFLDLQIKNKIILFHGIQNEKLLGKFSNYRFPIVLDYRDDPILQAEMNGIPINVDKAKKLIEYNFKSSDIILFPSKTLMDYYSEYKEKAIVVMNASDPSHFKYSKNPLNDKAICLYPPMPCFFYPDVLDASTLVRNHIKNFEISIMNLQAKYRKFYGDFDKTIHVKYEHPWISSFNSMPYSEIGKFISQFTIGIIAYKKFTYANLGTPLKLFDLMACGRPIVAMRCKEIEKIVSDANCGLLCDFTKEDLAEKMINLLENSDLIIKMGENGRRAVEKKHSWIHRAKVIQDEILKLT